MVGKKPANTKYKYKYEYKLGCHIYNIQSPGGSTCSSHYSKEVFEGEDGPRGSLRPGKMKPGR